MKKSLLGIINIIAAVITILMVIPVILASNEHRLLYLIIYISLLLLIVFLLIYFRFKEDTFRYLKYYFFTKSGKYNVNLKETVYEFKSRTQMFHQKKINITSRTNDLISISSRYGWSKDEVIPIKTLNKNHQIVKTWKSDKMMNFTILFDRYYRKGETLTTGFKLENLNDKNKESDLYLSTGIFEKTKLVRLILLFEKNLLPINIELKVFKNYFDISPYIIKKLEYDYAKKKIVFEHSYPIKLSKYIITWEFDE